MTSDEITMNFTSSRAVAARIWSRRTCCDASPSPGSPMTRNEKSLPAVDPGGATAIPLGGTLGLLRAERRPDHRLAPRVGSRLGPRVPHARGPVLGVEEPAHAEHRHDGRDDGRNGSPICSPRLNAVRRRIPRAAQPDSEPQPPFERGAHRPPAPAGALAGCRQGTSATPDARGHGQPAKHEAAAG